MCVAVRVRLDDFVGLLACCPKAERTIERELPPIAGITMALPVLVGHDFNCYHPEGICLTCHDFTSCICRANYPTSTNSGPLSCAQSERPSAWVAQKSSCSAVYSAK